MKHQLRWFENRIGKVVYGNDVICPRKTCKDITHGGLKIADKQHAQYLHMLQYYLDVDYRDNK